MARPIWSGSIAFGLVNVPVQMVPATKSQAVRFHQLHEKTGSRVQHRRVSTFTGEPVVQAEIVKGFEVTKGEHVVIPKEAIDALKPKTDRTINVTAFAELTEIDPLFFDKPYYLFPDEQGAKGYALLNRALADAGKVGLAKFVLRS